MATDESPLTNLSAVAAVAAMRGGDIRAEDYARALLDRAAATEPLNAFRTLDREMVLQAARAADQYRASGAALGLLHGLPIPVKDSVNTRALPTSNGTPALQSFRPRDDAELLQRLFAQGALLMGKTNLHELSFGWTSHNMAFGAVHNPFDTSRSPGGSSGGSAVAVAAHAAPLAVAEDTHGSIRVPAALCSLAGLRPTYGRYPGRGVMPMTLDKFDQLGPLARTVAELALFDAAATGDHEAVVPAPLKGVRLGVPANHFFDGLDAELERLTARAMSRLQDAGATLVRVDIPPSIQAGMGISMAIIGHELLASMAAFLAEHGAGITVEQVLAQVSPNIAETLAEAVLPPNGVPRHAYEQALRQRKVLVADLAQLYREHVLEALILPPVLCPAPPLDADDEILIGGRPVPAHIALGRNNALGTCASMACLVLPVGLTAGGLPVGIELDALPGRDRRLLALGLSIEQVLGAYSP